MEGIPPIRPLKKTTVYLRAQEYEALRRASYETGISRSELIRKGIRLVSAQLQRGGQDRAPRKEWLTRREEIVLSLTNAGSSPEQIARDQFVSEAEILKLRRSLRAKLAALAAEA